MYLDDSRHSAEALFLEAVAFGEEEALVLADLFELVGPGLIVLLVGNGDLDEDGLLFGAVLDDGPVREYLVVDFREIIVLITRTGFLLGRSHYRKYYIIFM
jgi:hypothetical protein